MSKEFDYSKHLRMLFLSKNMGINRKNLVVTIRFVSSSCRRVKKKRLVTVVVSSLSYVLDVYTCPWEYIGRNLISVVITPQMNV